MLLLIAQCILLISSLIFVLIGAFGEDKFIESDTAYSIAVVAFACCLGITVWHESVKNSNERHKAYVSTHKKINKILSKKTKHINSKAYIYGMYSKGSLSIDKTIVDCYDKFHTIRATAECVKGMLNYKKIQN